MEKGSVSVNTLRLRETIIAIITIITAAHQFSSSTEQFQLNRGCFFFAATEIFAKVNSFKEHNATTE